MILKTRRREDKRYEGCEGGGFDLKKGKEETKGALIYGV